MNLDKLLNSIETRLTYLEEHTSNPFIQKQCANIRIKMQEFRDRKYHTEKVVNDICDNIINVDISKMRRVITDETAMEYKKMDELASFVDQIRTVYFEEVELKAEE